MKQRLVVLANSRKSGGFCMAGKVLEENGRVAGWVRPVSSVVERGLPLSRIMCSDGLPAHILDVVAQDWGPNMPILHQSENRMMGPSTLSRCGRVSWSDLATLADNSSSPLWLDGYSSSAGRNDRVPSGHLKQLPGSLKLLAIDHLVLSRNIGFEGKTKHRAEFCVDGRSYNLALTDTVATTWLGQCQRLELPGSYVCVSLAVPFNDGFAYKVAATIITMQRAGSAT
jgi:hypothetical protein